jgi:hypothetical protein
MGPTGQVPNPPLSCAHHALPAPFGFGPVPAIGPRPPLCVAALVVPDPPLFLPCSTTHQPVPHLRCTGTKGERHLSAAAPFCPLLSLPRAPQALPTIPLPPVCSRTSGSHRRHQILSCYHRPRPSTVSATSETSLIGQACPSPPRHLS